MKEFQAIIQAYELYKNENKPIALATVVHVDGSAYRRPGARMLVSEDGDLTGAISGGCLEGDALRKAQSVIFQQKSMLVTYDTTDEDDQKFGVGLGCNGIIHVLIEPIDYQDSMNSVCLLKRALSDRDVCTLVTVFSIKNSRSEQIGTILLSKNGALEGHSDKLEFTFFQAISDQVKDTNQKSSLIKSYPEFDSIQVFYEKIKPATRLLLFGAGNDTIPIVQLAEILGFEVIVIDGRANHATTGRFPKAKEIIVGTADEVVNKLPMDDQTVALLMTHNFEYECVVLRQLINSPLPYIGILGPKKKSEKMIQRLENQGKSVKKDNLYSPMGLDIGAEGSEEIALSVLAEIKAVLAGKSGNFLKDKEGPIHEEIA
ncbi:xanthine/CO dehydrogenase XdhC/CoxF family maturation factor [Algoriphagus iocasae]|uniref:Xanthine/CO dehydrogenase XdhC/CoxF family maturation factor n=1 Tax=Algoriphagus iocasae TaxID=1836499 RepID=A0A841MRS8_9BACT|nr:XdhC/CoxI family protein [Algoriphagus iocasae]MBB6328379.1 xanthine/CO dehydrogenase XdhC/CoxF family maturation factor [Algoriphagus iocasae]